MSEATTDGWYPDPWQRWPERYYENGDYTDRVRSGRTEGHDPRPPAPPHVAAGYAPYSGPGSAAAGYPDYPGHPGYGQGYGAYGGYGGYGQAFGGYGYWVPPPPTTGNARTGPLPLHPMSLGDILDGAFKLYRANFKAILITVSVIEGPLQFLGAILRRNQLGGNSLFDINGTQLAQQNSNSTSTTSAIALIVVALVSLIAIPVVGGAISRIVSASYIGEVEAPTAALKAAGRRIVALIVASICVHFLEGIGFVLLILPGLIFMAMYVSVSPAIVLEELGPLKGMSRSWSLSKGRMWRVMGIALLSGFIVSTVGSVIADPFSLAGLAVGLHWGWILLFIGGLLGSLVTASLSTIIATLLYLDGRIRHEGLDLQLLARGIGA